MFSRSLTGNSLNKPKQNAVGEKTRVIGGPVSLTVVALASVSPCFPVEALTGFEQCNRKGGLTYHTAFCIGSSCAKALLKDTMLTEEIAVPGCITSIFKKAA